MESKKGTKENSGKEQEYYTYSLDNIVLSSFAGKDDNDEGSYSLVVYDKKTGEEILQKSGKYEGKRALFFVKKNKCLKNDSTLKIPKFFVDSVFNKDYPGFNSPYFHDLKEFVKSGIELTFEK